MNITGLHHVTAIASNPQRNLDFYVELLGLRLVKRTVNFDDPGSYHFYFGDAVGTPGTILTFFAWSGSRRGIHGSGEVSATAFTIPTGSASYWLERLKLYHVTVERAPKRLGEEVVRFADPDGMLIELMSRRRALQRCRGAKDRFRRSIRSADCTVYRRGSKDPKKPRSC